MKVEVNSPPSIIMYSRERLSLAFVFFRATLDRDLLPSNRFKTKQKIRKTCLPIVCRSVRVLSLHEIEIAWES